MVYLGVYSLARFQSKDPKIDLENRSMLIKITVELKTPLWEALC